MKKCKENMTPGIRKCGYLKVGRNVLKIPKVKVIDKGLFMAVLTAMHKTGMFDCYASELAAAVVAVFDVKLQLSSIQQDLYDQLLEYEDVLGFFNNYRKYEF